MPAARRPSETGPSRAPALRRSKTRRRRKSAPRDGSAPRPAPPRGRPRRRRNPPSTASGLAPKPRRLTRTSRWFAASGSIAANVAGESKTSPWTSTTRGPCRPHSIRSMTLISPYQPSNIDELNSSPRVGASVRSPVSYALAGSGLALPRTKGVRFPAPGHASGGPLTAPLQSRRIAARSRSLLRAAERSEGRPQSRTAPGLRALAIVSMRPHRRCRAGHPRPRSAGDGPG